MQFIEILSLTIWLPPLSKGIVVFSYCIFYSRSKTNTVPIFSSWLGVGGWGDGGHSKQTESKKGVQRGGKRVDKNRDQNFTKRTENYLEGPPPLGV